MRRNSVPAFSYVALGVWTCALCAFLLAACGGVAPVTPTSKPQQQSSVTDKPNPTNTPASKPLPQSSVTDKPKPTSTPNPTPRPVQIPAPPARSAIPSGSPAEQAVAMAKAVSPGSSDRLAGWLAVYDTLGIPVLGPGRSPLGRTGDDPIGPAFWRVWYMAGMTRPGTGFSLTDFAKMFNDSANPSFDSVKAGEILLQDLRAAITSKDRQVQLFGRFTAEMVKRGPSSVDLEDPKVTADQVVISGDLAELLSWVVMRDFVFSLAPAKTSSTWERPYDAAPGSVHYRLALLRDAPPVPVIPVAFLSAPALEQQGCSSLVSDDGTYWLNWALNKIVGGGVQLPGMTEATKGLVEHVQLKRGKMSENMIEKVKSVTNIANTVANVLTLAMQISALTLDSSMEPTPLERTKSIRDGKEAKVYFRLTYDPGSLPDGKNMYACVSSYLLNAFGVSFSPPASGRIAGAELTFEGGKGFGKYVLFGDYKQLRMDTNDNGEVELLVLGKGQKTELPSDAKPMPREFSIHVRGQPEAATGNTIANTFFDSLAFWVAPSAPGLINAGVDIAKTFHWDLGEFVYPLTDWNTGYRVDQPWGQGGHVTGTICSLDKPFTLRFTNPAADMVGKYTFTPSGNGSGTWSYSGTAVQGVVENAGAGNFTVEGVAEGMPVIKVGSGEWTQTTHAPAPMGTIVTKGNSPAETLVLETAEGCPN